jgi:hypothetical protein
MEISLMYVFSSTVGLGLISIILLGVLLNKTKLMNASILEQSSKENNNLVQAVKELSTSTNLRFDGVIATQNENKDFNVNLHKLIKDSFKQNDINSEKRLTELVRQNTNNSEHYKQALTDSTKKISTAVNEVSEKQTSIQTEDKALNAEITKLITTKSEDQKTISDKHFTQLKQEQDVSNSSIQKQVSKAHEQLTNSIGILSSEFERELKTQSFITKQERTSAFEQLLSLIQTIRVENLSDITNSIAKHKNLKISTADFEKQLGDCKVVQMTDKHTGQVTHFNYEKGIKRSSDTLDGDSLKYQMFFDDGGKVSKGVEFNDNGDVAFEYEYDKAGEIGKRNEYIYSSKTKVPKKIEKVY